MKNKTTFVVHIKYLLGFNTMEILFPLPIKETEKKLEFKTIECTELDRGVYQYTQDISEIIMIKNDWLMK